MTDLRELVEFVKKSGIIVSEEVVKSDYFDIKKAYEAAQTCEECTSRENCLQEAPGFRLVFRPGIRHLEFMYQQCDKDRVYQWQKQVQKILKSSRLPELYQEMTFEKFQVTPGTKEAYEAAKEFAHKGGQKGIVFAGPPGVGKSHLASAIMNVKASKCEEFIFCTSPELMDDIKSALDNKQQTTELMELVKNVDLLFLDDLGAERVTDFVVERFFVILNARLVRKKATIITTNYSRPTELIEKLGGGITGQRIVSRICEMCRWINMTGEDWRLKRA